MIRFVIILFTLPGALAPVYGERIGPQFMHCYDYGCKSSQTIRFNTRQWREIDNKFSPPALSPWMEKQQIRLAVALMEEFSGELTGTALDRGGNYNEEELAFQQDCIDESTNTMQYLNALDERGLLHWHQAAGKERRIVWFFTHWTALIRELDNDQIYAVDSWYRDNGEPPFIQPLGDWRSRRSFPEQLNP